MIGKRSRFIWRALRAKLRDERGELSAARSAIESGSLVCDIGAHKGNYLFWLSRWAGRVVAFEPQPRLAEYLKSLALANVTVEAKGVYSRSGKLDLHIPCGAPAGASLNPVSGRHERISIPVVSLDDYFPHEERISFIKIDVEGTELDVFHGAERILTEQGPVLLFECEGRHHADGNISAVFDYLKKLGYTGEFINRGHRQPLSSFDPDIHQRQQGERFWDAPGYCNNFLFFR